MASNLVGQSQFRLGLAIWIILINKRYKHINIINISNFNKELNIIGFSFNNKLKVNLNINLT